MVKIIVGLGNPGKEYAATRHNVGFMVLQRLRADLDQPAERQRFRSKLVEGRRHSEKVVLAAPQTFMNLSGLAVREIWQWNHADLKDLLIVLDDMDLPFGVLRMRGAGSAGGHNGLKSIVEQLGTNEVPRLRVGIGRGRGDSIGHVLSRFSAEEEAELPDLVSAARDAVLKWCDQGLLATMNDVNRLPEASPATSKAGLNG